MRAPLVVGVTIVAAGIAAGAHWPVSAGDGPFVFGIALGAAALGFAMAAQRGPGPGPAGPGRRGAGVVRGWPGAGLVPWGLLLVAGLLLGVAARAAGDGSCAARLPAELPATVYGSVSQRSGDRVRIHARSVELAGARIPCRGELLASLEGAAQGGAEADIPREVRVEGRWWRPPGRRGLAPTGLFRVESLRPVGDVADRGRPGILAELRAGARRRVDRLFGEEAALAASLLLAQRDGLDRDVRDRFARAGLSHLLAISGLHVALVAGLLMLLAGAARLGKGPGAAAAGLGTVAYVLFLGAPHSASRAALQIVLVLAARAAQRPARTEALIATAALLLLARDPAALFSPGFQLSFAGVAGILLLRRPLLRRLKRLPGLRDRAKVRWLADGLATSAAATVATAPVVAWHFGRVAPIGVVANLVAIPLLSATVPALAMAMGVGAVWHPGGAFLAEGGRTLLMALDRTAAVAAGVGAVPVPGSVAAVLTAAVVGGWLATRRLGRVRPSVRRLVWGGVAGVVLLLAPLRPGTDRVEIHVIDVGQGDAIAIRSPVGRWLLVDAGVARESYDAGARLVVPYLSRHGVTRLEGLILTHPDADHVGGAGAVLAALRPRWVADPGRPASKADYLALLRAAAGAGVPWLTARRGLELEVDGVRLEVLHPYRGVDATDANEVSVVVRLVYGAFEALLTGDAPAEVERALVRRYGRRLESDVLKVGHHGSRTSTTGELLTATGATLALVSAGRGNRYGHPHRSVLGRLEAAGLSVARTDRHGSIVVRGTPGGRFTVETERRDPGWRGLAKPLQ
jgi:competence protein ComEC